MPLDAPTAVTAAAFAAAVLACLALVASLLGTRHLARQLDYLRLDHEQILAAQRDEAHGLRTALAATERALATTIHTGSTDGMGRALGAIHGATQSVGTASDRMRAEVAAALGDLRTSLSGQMRELREANDAKLAQIQQSVNEQLHEAVEKQMTASFARVVDQFAAVQKAMSDVQAVTSQIVDIKRLFSNVATRGGWGETQVRAMLDDMLPPGAYDTNWRPRADRAEVVEFALIMPMRGAVAPRLPIDAKFPTADYERLVLAAEAGDAEGERVARRALERVIREQARSIQSKYIVPPATVEFAVMYLPTDGLYTEIARSPGLIDEIGRLNRVIIVGPSLLPALLRTIHLGHVTLAIEQKAEEIRSLLGATRTEMIKMDDLLDRLHKQAGTFAATIERARTRNRAVSRRLRAVEALDSDHADRLLGMHEIAELAPDPDEPVEPSSLL